MLLGWDKFKKLQTFATHNDLGGLNDDDYKHLTAAEFASAILDRAAPGEIGGTTPAAASFTQARIAQNNSWISGLNFAGAADVNMFKINVDDEIDVGGTLVLGATLEAAVDSGAVTLVDMPVSSTPAAGNEMSFTQKIDGNNIFKVYAEANSSGGIQNLSVRLIAPLIYDQAPQVLTGAGAVDITSAITHIVTDGVNALTLADGVEGQTKFIVMKTDVNTGTLTPTNLGNGATITFDDVGDSAHLLFTNGSWHFMGGTATLA